MKFCRFGIVVAGLGCASFLLAAIAGNRSSQGVGLITGATVCAAAVVVLLIGMTTLSRYFRVNNILPQPAGDPGNRWKLIVREVAIYSCLLAAYFWFAEIKNLDMPVFGDALEPAIAFSLLFLSSIAVLAVSRRSQRAV